METAQHLITIFADSDDESVYPSAGGTSLRAPPESEDGSQESDYEASDELTGLETDEILDESSIEEGSNSGLGDDEWEKCPNPIALMPWHKPFDCPICLETIIENGCITSCDHTFCETCSEIWFRTQTTCPLCRSNLQ